MTAGGIAGKIRAFEDVQKRVFKGLHQFPALTEARVLMVAGRISGMEIAERVVEDVTVLDLKGKMTLGEGDELLKDKINSLLANSRKKLVLNLEGVPYIDSAGLGEIVRTYTTVSRQGGSLKLLNLTKRIEDLLSITKLLTVFETFDTEAEAIESFSA